MATSRHDRGSGWRRARRVVDKVVRAGSEDNVPMMAAAISYYLLLTIAPLAIVMSLAVAGLRGIADPSAAAEAPIARTLLDSSGGGSTLTLVATLGVVLFGAAGVFGQFVLAVTRIWKEPERRGPLYSFARRHGLAFLLLAVLALGLLVSLVLGAVLSAIVSEAMALAASLGIALPSLDLVVGGRLVVDFIASGVLFTTAFTLIPSSRPRVRDVVPGAAVTAFAYALGQVGLGVYLANSSRVALYGALGGLVALLLWAYYSSMIALYGAELTRALVLGTEEADPPA